MVAGRLEDKSLMPFGKYAGECVLDVPDSYLLWCADQDWVRQKYPDLYAYIEHVRVVLESDAAHDYAERCQGDPD